MPDKLSIEHVMRKDFIVVTPNTTVYAASYLMSRHGSGAIVVMQDGKPVGIFTERDLLSQIIAKRHDPSEVKVEDVMTREIVSVRRSSSVEEAHVKMLSANIRHLLVLENGYLVGILSIRDLLRYRDRILELRVEQQTNELLESKTKLTEQNEKYKQEKLFASKFQKDLIVKRYPVTDRLKFAHVYEQAEDLGGDFLAVVRIDRDHIGVFVADVMGHGIISAMIAIEVKMKFDQYYPKYLSPAPVLTHMNKEMIPLMPTGYFVAGLYAVINTETLMFEYTQFGLPRPVLFRTKLGRPQPLLHGNMPIGIQRDTKYISRVVMAKPGDKLLLFTDGCTEQKNPKGRVYGERKFLQELRKSAEEEPSVIVKKLYQSVLDYAKTEPIYDDIAILCCEFAAQ